VASEDMHFAAEFGEVDKVAARVGRVHVERPRNNGGKVGRKQHLRSSARKRTIRLSQDTTVGGRIAETWRVSIFKTDCRSKSKWNAWGASSMCPWLCGQRLCSGEASF
jgi:hypothetical protein